MNELSARLQEAIRASGMSQRELEAKTGISHAAIQRYASGSTDRIPIRRIEKSAEDLNVPVAYILGWVDFPSVTTSENSAQEEKLIQIFRTLSVVGKAKLLALADELKNKENEKTTTVKFAARDGYIQGTATDRQTIARADQKSRSARRRSG